MGFELSLLAAEKEADFSIHMLKELNVFGHTVYLTTTHVGLIIVSVVLLIFAIAVNRSLRKVNASDTPGMLQNIAEMIVTTIDNMVKGIMGSEGKRFRNYICVLMMFLLLCNISGLFGLRAPTADYGVTLPLGIITFLLIHINGVKKNHVGHFTALFKPSPILFPINLFGEVGVPFSFSFRLFVIVLSGTVMLGLIYVLLSPPVTTGIPAFLHVYFDIFSGCIQAYVFCMLTMVYINDKIAD